jgi:hypothetical protein
MTSSTVSGADAPAIAADVPGRVADITPEFIETHTVFIGSSDRVYELPGFKVDEDVSDDTTEFRGLLSDGSLSPLAGFAAINAQSILIFKINSDKTQQAVLWDALECSCNLIGMSAVHGSPTVTVIVHRIRGRKIAMPVGMMMLNLWVPSLKGKRDDTTDAKIRVFKAFARMGDERKYNFIVAPIGTHTAATVVDSWESKPLKEIDWEITLSKAMASKNRSERERIVVAIGDRYISRRRHQLDITNPVMCRADDETLLPLSSFVGGAALVCQTFDPSTGSLIRFPLSDWLEKAFCEKYCLVLFGQSDLGKTALASSLCGFLARADQHEHPYYLKAGTLDILREAVKDGLMLETTPIVLDELTPGAPRGSRACMTLHELKRLCEVEGSSTSDGRCNDITFSAGQARVFTSNAMCPFDWHPKLPENIWVMSDASRALLAADVKAVFKRCVFVVVESSLIPQALRASFATTRRESKKARYTGAFA